MLHSTPLLLLAPMAGITDLPFRLVCKKHGADVVYSEMISAAGMFYGRDKVLADNKSLQLALTTNEEQPLVIQLFGNDPEHFAFAAKTLNELPAYPSDEPSKAGLYRPVGIDINFGCPVPKVMKQGSGCHLMRNLDLSYHIIKAVTDNTSLPVSIKIRAGIEDTTAYEFIEKVAALPWTTVMIHARTYRQGFSGPADFEMIKTIKEKYSEKTVIANGGIFSPEAAKEMLYRTQADGLGIARGCLGNPWLFQQIKEYFSTGTYTSPSLEEIKKTALHQAALMHSLLGPASMLEMRKHLGWYFKGFDNAKELRKQLLAINTYEEIQTILSPLSPL